LIAVEWSLVRLLPVVMILACCDSDVVVDYGFILEGTVIDGRTLVPQANVQVAVAWNGDRNGAFQSVATTSADGRYRYDWLGPTRPVGVHRFRKRGFADFFADESEIVQLEQITFRLDAVLERDGSTVDIEISDAATGGLESGSLVVFTLTLEEYVGIGRNLDRIRVVRSRVSGEVDADTELGANEIIQQSGSNRLEANDRRRLELHARFASPPRASASHRVIVILTNDHGETESVEAAF